MKWLAELFGIWWWWWGWLMHISKKKDITYALTKMVATGCTQSLEKNSTYRLKRIKMVSFSSSMSKQSILKPTELSPAVEERFTRDHKLKTAIGNWKDRLWQCFKKRLGGPSEHGVAKKSNSGRWYELIFIYQIIFSEMDLQSLTEECWHPI